MTMMMIDDKVICLFINFIEQHLYFTSFVILTIIVGIFSYFIISCSIVPGFSNVIVLKLNDSKIIYPRTSILSLTSNIEARFAWILTALKRGKTPNQLAKEIINDYEFDWTNENEPKYGQFIHAWNRIFEWNNDCINMTTFDAMRNKGDPLTDEVIKEREMQKDDKEGDHLEYVAECIISKNIASKSQELWKSINRRPPPGCGALSLEWYRKNGLITEKQEFEWGYEKITKKTIEEMEFWKSTINEEENLKIEIAEKEILNKGRKAYLKFGPNIQLGLLLVGLSGGFASKKITKVLKSTGYLIQKNNGKTSKIPTESSSNLTFKRLLETMTFILDLMENENSLDPPFKKFNLLNDEEKQELNSKDLLNLAGQGWISCCRVRFLHSSIRNKFSGKKISNEENKEENEEFHESIIINQEDLLATLCAFTIAPLWSLQRLGILPTLEERQLIISFWRQIGFYLGIEIKFLKRFFRDIFSAEQLFSCISVHHFMEFSKEFSCSSPPPSIPIWFGPKVLKEKNLKSKNYNLSNKEENLMKIIENFDFNKGPALPLLWSVSNRQPGNLSFTLLCGSSRFLIGNNLSNLINLPRMTRYQFFLVRIRLFIIAFPVLFGQFYPRKFWLIELSETFNLLIKRIIIWLNNEKRTTFKTLSDFQQKGLESYSSFPLNSKDGKEIIKRYYNLFIELFIVLGFIMIIALLLLSITFKFTIFKISNLLEQFIVQRWNICV